MSAGGWVIGSALVGALGGAGVRTWLVTLSYRRPSDVGSPTPGGRWWLLPVAGAVSATLAWRIFVAGPGTTSASAAEQGLSRGIVAPVVLVVFIVTTWACLALAAIDLDVHRLPDLITGPTLVWLVVGLGVAAVAGAGWSPWLRMLACAAVSGVFYLLLSLVSLTRGSSPLGLGDVKLSVLLGATTGWFGIQSAIVGLYAGFLIGGASALVLLVFGRVTLRGHLAFGPPMMLGALCGVLLPPDSMGAMF